MARVTGKKFHREPCKVKDGRLIYGEVRLYGLFIQVGRGNVQTYQYLCPCSLR